MVSTLVGASVSHASYLLARVLTPCNSTVGGAVLAWGVIAPSLVKNGLAFGKSISDDFPLISYQSLSFTDPDVYSKHPSPRYWLLWPGVLMMLVYSVSLRHHWGIPILTMRVISVHGSRDDFWPDDCE